MPKSGKRLIESAQQALEFAKRAALEKRQERRWQKRFAETQDALGKLADEALAEWDAGLTEPLDPDKL